MPRASEPTLSRLRRIADLLDVPVECLLGDRGSPSGFAKTRECLRLWSMITTEEARHRALEGIKAALREERP